MIWIRWVFIGWVCFITLLLGFAWENHQPSLSTRTFCAYNKVFVEFEEGSHVWGTMMLDRDGRPVPCKSDVDDTPVKNYNEREIYDKSI